MLPEHRPICFVAAKGTKKFSHKKAQKSQMIEGVGAAKFNSFALFVPFCG